MLFHTAYCSYISLQFIKYPQMNLRRNNIYIWDYWRLGGRDTDKGKEKDDVKRIGLAKWITVRCNILGSYNSDFI
jgi:hypothetical protein